MKISNSENYLKTEMKFYNRKLNKTFHNNKIPKESSPLTCLSLILIDSVYRKDKN